MKEDEVTVFSGAIPLNKPIIFKRTENGRVEWISAGGAGGRATKAKYGTAHYRRLAEHMNRMKKEGRPSPPPHPEPPPRTEPGG